MSEVIYRKYRPKTFKEVIGQKPIKITLQNEVVSGNVAHAYLLVGPRGTGKTTLARLFARALNCLNRKGDDPEPCNHCQICQLILAGRSLDIIEIDAASHTGVDNVRENIIASAQVPPFNSKGYKVFIIDEVHMLSKSAFNALLKTLEEPPRQVIFILATTEVHKVPETIISRCQRFDFKKIPQKDIVQRLSEIIEWEKVSVPDHLLTEIARRSEGCLRDAESLLGQIISLGQGQVTDELASLVLPRSNWQEVDTLITALRLSNLANALNQINRLVNEGADWSEFNNNLVEYLRQIVLYQIIGPSFIIDFPEDLTKAIKEHAEEFPLSDLNRLLNIILDKLTIRSTLIDQLPLELACIEFLVDKDVTLASPETPVVARPKNKIVKKTDQQNLKKISEAWPEIIKEMKVLNHSLSAILQTSHPLEADHCHLVIGVEFPFHLEQLDRPQVKNYLNEILNKKLGAKLEVEFIIDESYQINHQAFKGKNDKEVGDALDTFGGEVV